LIGRGLQGSHAVPGMLSPHEKQAAIAARIQ
jgi:hypothetical protein